jgi:hypothetical protein
MSSFLVLVSIRTAAKKRLEAGKINTPHWCIKRYTESIEIGRATVKNLKNDINSFLALSKNNISIQHAHEIPNVSAIANKCRM